MLSVVDVVNLLEIPNLQAGILGTISAVTMYFVGHYLYHHDQGWIEEDLNRLFKSMAGVVLYVSLIFLGFGMVEHSILIDDYGTMLDESNGLRYVFKLVGAGFAVAAADWATQLLRDGRRNRDDSDEDNA
jgi:hypothetical protein